MFSWSNQSKQQHEVKWWETWQTKHKADESAYRIFVVNRLLPSHIPVSPSWGFHHRRCHNQLLSQPLTRCSCVAIKLTNVTSECPWQVNLDTALVESTVNPAKFDLPGRLINLSQNVVFRNMCVSFFIFLQNAKPKDMYSQQHSTFPVVTDLTLSLPPPPPPFPFFRLCNNLLQAFPFNFTSA